MKFKYIEKRIAILCLLLVFISCRKENVDSGIGKDFKISEEVIGDQVYKCINIGGQIWMAENLRIRLEGGRADGAMTYGEVRVDNPSKALLIEELKKALQEKAFGTDPMNHSMIDFVINYDIIPNYLQLGSRYYSRTWKEYSSQYRTNPANEWALPYFDQAEVVYLDREKKLKQKLILEAADMEYANTYGYLYSYEAAKKIAPKGWRVPTDEDWKALEVELGIPKSEIDLMDVWRGQIGAALKAGNNDNFNGKFGGGLVYGKYPYGDNYIHKGTRAYWWSSTKHLDADTASLYIIRGIRIDNNKVLRGTSRSNGAYHIRLIKE